MNRLTYLVLAAVYEKLLAFLDDKALEELAYSRLQDKQSPIRVNVDEL